MGRKVFAVMGVLCVMGLGLRAQGFGSNLIVNGDAETAPVVDGTNWFDFSTTDFGDASGSDGGVWYLTNSTTYPQPYGSPMRSHGGNQFFNAGINLVSSTDSRTLTQTVRVPAFAGQNVTYTFSGWVATNGTFGGIPNVVEIKLEYLDGTGTSVYTYDNTYTPATSTYAGWFNMTGSQDVLGTDDIDSVRVTLIAQNANTSTPIQAYFDDLSLIANLTLPVTLVDFHALREGDGSVGLDWETAQEQNSKYMEVQRSGDGKTFTAIGRVAAAGNSLVPRDYTFRDESPLAGTNYYRLRMVDIDGAFKYSRILAIGFGAEAIGIYGNPFHDQLGVRIAAVSAERIVLSLFDQTGRVCLRQNYTAQKGENLINLYPRGLASGVYLLQVRGERMNRTIKVLKE